MKERPAPNVWYRAVSWPGVWNGLLQAAVSFNGAVFEPAPPLGV